jgi:hypothetical protein
MVDRKKSDFRFPVALVKERKPEGHSGQRRLQAVVGSKEMVIGNPHWMGLFSHLVR